MTATPTVEAQLAEWIAAFNAHDLDRHMQLYTEDAMLFGAVDDLKLGRANVRSYFGGRAPMCGSNHIRCRKYVKSRPISWSPAAMSISPTATRQVLTA